MLKQKTKLKGKKRKTSLKVMFKPGFFFTGFFYFASKWISPILEFRKKILEFRGKFLEFREKILSLGRKNRGKMSVFTYFF